MAEPEDQRRRSLLYSIERNVKDLINHSQELESRVRGIHLQVQQADHYFLEIAQGIKDPGTLDNTKTDDLVNFYLETQAHLERVKRLNKDLDRTHNSMDFFPHQHRHANQVHQEDHKEDHL